MKATKKILAGIGIATLVGLVIYMVRRRAENNRLTEDMNEEISEHGYETAHDILFPRKNKGDRKTHYGPVLPG